MPASLRGRGPEAPPERIRVEIPRVLTLYPTGDREASVSVLGLTPLLRFGMVDPRGEYLENQTLEPDVTVLTEPSLTHFFEQQHDLPAAIDKYQQKVYHYPIQRVFDFTPGKFSMLHKTNIGERQGQSILSMAISRGNDDVDRA